MFRAVVHDEIVTGAEDLMLTVDLMGHFAPGYEGKFQKIVAMAQKEFTQIFPKPGWVEHDADEIFATQLEVARQALQNAGISAAEIAAIGITNQRETTIVWDRHTGRPVYNAIVWQCRRTADYCDRLTRDGWVDTIRSKTGLVIDPYFSGTKVRWILENVPGAREKAEKGDSDCYYKVKELRAREFRNTVELVNNGFYYTEDYEKVAFEKMADMVTGTRFYSDAFSVQDIVEN